MAQMAISLHIFFIVSLLVILARNLYLVIGTKDFVKTYKSLQMITPIYHTVNACVIFTGTVVQFFHTQFNDFTVYLMIFASIFIMVSEIKRYKKMRIIKSNETQKQQEAFKFAKKVYIINMSIILTIYLIEKIF